MADLPKEIPKRPAYKAAEVCEIARIQAYVLRSWESEFPKLGVVRGGVRIYRHADLEQVLRIKQLVFEEGLTLAGARRRIEEDGGPQPDLPLEQFVTPEMKDRITQVKRTLRDLLVMLGGGAAAAVAERADASGGSGRPALESAVPGPGAISVVSAARAKKAARTAARRSK